MFLLAFFSRRANRQGLWIGITCALISTAWATLTGGQYKMLTIGWDFGWPDVMIGVIAHVIVLVVGYGASWFFPAEHTAASAWTFWNWLERRKPERGQNVMPGLGLEANS
jgi:SSS family solute:Na+ symporter